MTQLVPLSMTSGVTPAAIGAATPSQIPPILRGHLAGLTLSTAGSSATFSVAAGMATDSAAADYLSLAASVSKTTAAWVVGTGTGALDTGTIANSTWYHVFLIKRPDTAVVDVLISLSATAPTLPTSYTLFRRIGAMKTDSSGNWTKFVQLGDEFLWDTDVLFANGSIGTTATTLAAIVPSGVQVTALVRVQITAPSAAITNLLLSSLDQSDQAAGGAFSLSVGPTNGTVTAGEFAIRTNTASSIRARASAASVSTYGTTKGWIDRRGRDS